MQRDQRPFLGIAAVRPQSAVAQRLLAGIVEITGGDQVRHVRHPEPVQHPAHQRLGQCGRVVGIEDRRPLGADRPRRVRSRALSRLLPADGRYCRHSFGESWPRELELREIASEERQQQSGSHHCRVGAGALTMGIHAYVAKRIPHILGRCLGITLRIDGHESRAYATTVVGFRVQDRTGDRNPGYCAIFGIEFDLESWCVPRFGEFTQGRERHPGYRAEPAGELQDAVLNIGP